ncbi:MAG: sulfite exporter TauE/SafE family protein [Candidatus Omnitrophica bacterium]|nr:sulfite exporter TauE/SafE family protein [Candidatus Omnitrophota bacterium]
MELLIYYQLFGIGLSFGVAGPCFLSCTPFFITYLAGKQLKWRQGLIEALIFLSGRLFAYLVLGYLAGLSTALLRQFGSSSFILFLKPLGGVIIISLGILILFSREPAYCGCKFLANKVFTFGSLFILGFIMGVSPCAPLLALLFEITIISKTAFQGLLCALSFGLGAFISGFIVIAGLSGLISWFPAKVQKSSLTLLVFRIIFASLLILMGLNLILSKTSRIL